jgi:hypothetical protein
MKKVRIDESLLEQIEFYDVFPRGVWSKQARVNYLIQIGLAILLLRFEQDAKKQSDGQGIDITTQFLRSEAVDRLLRKAAETKVPNSQLAKLVNKSLYE